MDENRIMQTKRILISSSSFYKRAQLKAVGYEAIKAL
jgi:hypothetical protein